MKQERKSQNTQEASQTLRGDLFFQNLERMLKRAPKKEEYLEYLEITQGQSLNEEQRMQAEEMF